MLLVVTPSLGRSPYLEQTVISVAALSIAHSHILVVPAPLVEQMRESYPSVDVIAEPADSRSMYTAINAGIAAGGGAWTHFTYINDDDLLHKSDKYWIAALGSDSISYGNVSLIDKLGRVIGYVPVSIFPRINSWLWSIHKTPYTQQGMVVPRGIFEQHGGFDDRFCYGGDMEYWVKLERAGVLFRYYNALTASFRITTGQLSANRQKYEIEIGAIDSRYALGAKPDSLRYLGTILLAATNPRSYLLHLVHFGLRSRASMFQ